MKIFYKIIDGFEDIKFSNTPIDGYDDITSVKNFIAKGNQCFKDYKFVRKRFQELDWNTLTDEEKVIVAQRKGTSEENCKAVLGETYEFWMTDFDKRSNECRKDRFSYAKTVLIKNVILQDRYVVLGTLNATPLVFNYIEYGIEGIGEGDLINGLFNFVEATEGFVGTGITDMNITMLNSVTKEEMVEKMMLCLREGDYQ